MYSLQFFVVDLDCPKSVTLSKGCHRNPKSVTLSKGCH